MVAAAFAEILGPCAHVLRDDGKVLPRFFAVAQERETRVAEARGRSRIAPQQSGLGSSCAP